jgi:hypothetical protein
MELDVDAVRMNPLTSKASNAETEKQMKEWLKFASERDGGRKDRVSRQMANNCSGSVRVDVHRSNRIDAAEGENC